MKVTPLDLRQQKFKTVMRGYDRGEVSAFLLEAADDYEGAIRENDKLRQEVAKLDAVLGEHRSQERNLKNTLMTAQKLADEIKDHANQEAALIVREAEGRCDLLLQKAQGRLEDIQREIDGLRMKRREAETSIESLMGTLHNTLEFIREQDARAREEKVLLHRPRMAEAAEPRAAVAGSTATPAHPATHAPAHPSTYPVAPAAAQPAAHTAHTVAHTAVASHPAAQPAAPAAYPTAHPAAHPAAQTAAHTHAAEAARASHAAQAGPERAPTAAAITMPKPHVPLGR